MRFSWYSSELGSVSGSDSTTSSPPPCADRLGPPDIARHVIRYQKKQESKRVSMTWRAMGLEDAI
jgi:hypothetical protein